jgi:hypothetical protein
MKGKPFAYLEGATPADDAPVMDNPARLYCRKCRADGRQVCDDPGYCGNLEPMKPLPDAIEEAALPNPTSAPRRGSKELTRPPKLDDSTGQTPLVIPEDQKPHRTHIVSKDPKTYRPVLPERVMGRKTTIRQIPKSEDWKEQSWEWFFEQVTHGLDGEKL